MPWAGGSEGDDPRLIVLDREFDEQMVLRPFPQEVLWPFDDYHPHHAEHGIEPQVAEVCHRSQAVEVDVEERKAAAVLGNEDEGRAVHFAHAEPFPNSLGEGRLTRAKLSPQQ